MKQLRTFGARLEDARIEARHWLGHIMSQVELAERLGIASQTVSQWENYDQKRDVTGMLGIAFAHGQQSRSTTVRDMMSNARLARYHTSTDQTTVD